MSTLKCVPQIIVKDVHPNLQQELRTARRPAHLLLIDESINDDLIDRGLDEAGRNTLAASVARSRIVRKLESSRSDPIVKVQHSAKP